MAGKDLLERPDEKDSAAGFWPTRGGRFWAGAAMLIIGGLIVLGCKSKPKTLTYSADIQPLFSNKCVTCHSANGTAREILLDSYENVKSFVKPGDAKNSRLVQAVDTGGRMSGRLSGSEVETVKNWVNQGAKP